MQPFYVQIGDKVYSSSTAGHLVISGLTDKTCNFELGFPQQATRPQRFSIPLHNKDHGYQLQKSGSRGWVLYDWQTDELIKPLKEAGSTALYGERKKDDAFANLMAAVVNDSAVLYTSIVKKENPPVPGVVNAGTKAEEKQPVTQATEKQVDLVDTPASAKKADIATTSAPATVDSPGIKTEVVAPDTASQLSKTSTDAPVTKYDPQEKALIGTRDTASQAVTKYDPQEKTLADTRDTASQAAVTKYDPQEKALNDIPAQKGVAKIQQQTKDGETKMVFVDSSESPAKVVTVYIEEEKKAADEKFVSPIPTSANDTLKANTNKSEERPVQPAKDSAKTTVPAEPMKKEEPAVKEKEKPALNKDEIAEKIKRETWGSVSEKKSNATDTATIILESRQLKKGGEGPKEESKTDATKPVNRDTAIKYLKPSGTGGEETPKAEPVKPALTQEDIKKAEEPVKTQAKVEPETKPAAEPAKKPETPTVAAKAVENEKPKSVEPEKQAETGSKLVMINSDCVKLATDNDVDKMRVKLVGENDSQKRLALANKYFKTMCLYARHIKALSELFPGDEAKYKFLEMAYPFAADTANFKTLHELLTEEMYVTKFKKLVRLQ
ncbi:DUF4476 domain-containing protein [Longitalea arenae]|uniref:DUF4476 domain-containing protein n=1 Tax=Longitalea arenae TaxID=2812558 RepID=UPI001967EAC6|nr:DUF4476 domain-containing protein [Longitalea arenae]